MPLIRAAGRTFHVQRLGTGAPVVMVHGLVIGNLAVWYFGVAPRLARGRSVLIYDQRGHGLSEPADQGFDLATTSADLLAVLGAVEGFGGEVDLVGHSYGGNVVLRFAMDHPGRTRRLVIVDAPLPPFDPAEAASMIEIDPVEIQRLLDAGGERMAEAVTRFSRGTPRRRSRLAMRTEHLRDRTSVTDDLRSEPPFEAARLRALHRPVLCLYGDRSPFRHRADELGAALPDARVVEMKGGHLLPIESPDEVTAAIEAFLDG